MLITGYAVSQAIYVAAKLGVADLLADGPRQGAELARATSTCAASLSRVLRLLASAGVLSEVAPDRFALAPVGDLLRDDVARSQRAFAVMIMELGYPAWGQLLHAVATGEPGFPQAFGVPQWEYMAHHPEAAAVFDAAMVGHTRWQAEAILAAYDFSSCRVVVDVGGGRGTLLAAILAAHPRARGVLFDLPRVIADGRDLLDRARVAGRCTFVGGDFLASVPAGGDTYILKGILHDWDDARAAAILDNCRQAMGAGGKLLLIEWVVPPGTATPAHQQVLWSDVQMMVLFGSRERTAQEFTALLERAGFRLGQVMPLDSGHGIFEAIAT
jgi:hypothetical protein